MEAAFGDFQYGFRKGRQCAEVVATLLRIKEIALQWNAGYVLYRVDVKKAFDTVLHSSVISMLMRQGVDMRVTYAIAREITHTYQHVKMFGLAADMPTRMFRGIKQGSPLSGILFVATVGEKLQKLQAKWKEEGMGIWIDTLHLSHLLFADDLVLIAPNGYHIRRMLADLEGVLAEIGLIFNAKKLSYVYGPHTPEMAASVQELVGEDLSLTGMRILGRLFYGHGQRDDLADMKAKQMRTWQQYHAYKGLFRSHATIKKRLQLVQSCLLSVQLWLCETWKPCERIFSSLRGLHYALLRATIPLPVKEKVEGEHGNITHARWVLKQLQQHHMHLADALFLQRYFRWAGHVARSAPKHVHTVHVFRDQYWWEHQQTRKEGYRHTVGAAHINTWESTMVEALGSCWKESAQNRERWQLIPAFLEIFQKNKAYPRRSPQKRKYMEEAGEGQNTVKKEGQTPKVLRQVTQEESTVATPLVPRQVSTRAGGEAIPALANDSCPEQQSRLKQVIPEIACGEDLERAQRKARQKRPKEYKGMYARYGGQFRRLHSGKIHTKGKLTERGTEIWKPLPQHRRKHIKRKVQDFGESTKLIDLVAGVTAGAGHGGQDVFTRIDIECPARQRRGGQ